MKSRKSQNDQNLLMHAFPLIWPLGHFMLLYVDSGWCCLAASYWWWNKLCCCYVTNLTSKTAQNNKNIKTEWVFYNMPFRFYFQNVLLDFVRLVCDEIFLLFALLEIVSIFLSLRFHFNRSRRPANFHKPILKPTFYF